MEFTKYDVAFRYTLFRFYLFTFKQKRISDLGSSVEIKYPEGILEKKTIVKYYTSIVTILNRMSSYYKSIENINTDKVLNEMYKQKILLGLSLQTKILFSLHIFDRH